MMKNFFLFLALGFSFATIAQIPLLYSNPTYTTKVIYLDFDGQVVKGTGWNNGNTVNAQPSNASAASIIQIWKRMSEDYRPFDVNVTTDSNAFNAANPTKRIRVIFTPTSSWYGNGAGGVAFVGSFTWGGYPGTPCWVFENMLGNNVKSMAEAASHEVGHTLSLRHQSTYNSSCVKTNEYHPGIGSGITSWAPIMGVGYTKNVTVWHNGPNAQGCNVIQPDHSSAYMTGLSYLNFIPDDVGGTFTTSKFLSLGSVNSVDSGIISQPGDLDYYRFTICENRYVGIHVKPWALDTVNYSGANLDIRLFLYNASNNLIAVDTSLTQLRARVGANLTPGTYYFTIDGGRSSNYSDYGSLGKYYLSIKATNPPALTATVNTGTTVCAGQPLSISAQANGTVGSYQWNISGATTVTSSASAFSQTFSPGIHTISLHVANSSYTGCPVSATMEVLPFPTVSIAGNTLICPPQAISLMASGAQSYTWMPGNSTGAIKGVNASGPLAYTVTGSNGVCSRTAAISLSVNPAFTVSIVASRTMVCQGDTVTLVAGGASSYTLSPGTINGNSVVVTPGVSSNYYLIGSVGSCEQTEVVSIVVIPMPNLNIVVSKTIACFGDTISLQATGAVNYTFEPGGITTNPANFTPSVSTVYTVTAYSNSMCPTQSTLNVQMGLCGVALQTYLEQHAAVFPNPATDRLTVTMDGINEVIVTSATGAEVMRQRVQGSQETVIGCATWARGLYTFRLVHRDGVSVERRVMLQ